MDEVKDGSKIFFNPVFHFAKHMLTSDMGAISDLHLVGFKFKKVIELLHI
jgi:hypothetical protein